MAEVLVWARAYISGFGLSLALERCVENSALCRIRCTLQRTRTKTIRVRNQSKSEKQLNRVEGHHPDAIAAQAKPRLDTRKVCAHKKWLLHNCRRSALLFLCLVSKYHSMASLLPSSWDGLPMYMQRCHVDIDWYEAHTHMNAWATPTCAHICLYISVAFRNRLLKLRQRRKINQVSVKKVYRRLCGIHFEKERERGFRIWKAILLCLRFTKQLQDLNLDLYWWFKLPGGETCLIISKYEATDRTKTSYILIWYVRLNERKKFSNSICKLKLLAH